MDLRRPVTGSWKFLDLGLNWSNLGCGGHPLAAVRDRTLTRALSGVPDSHTPCVPSSSDVMMMMVMMMTMMTRFLFHIAVHPPSPKDTPPVLLPAVVAASTVRACDARRCWRGDRRRRCGERRHSWRRHRRWLTRLCHGQLVSLHHPSAGRCCLVLCAGQYPRVYRTPRSRLKRPWVLRPQAAAASPSRCARRCACRWSAS